jgi:hypothetical protein
MFQLIVTIISIALIVALALASIFYGGSAFTNSAAKTAEAALVNGGQQIAGAAVLYRNDNAGANVTSISSLTSANSYGVTYLQAVPSLPTGLPTGAAWGETTAADFAVVKIDVAANAATNATCLRVAHDNNQPSVSVATATAGAASVTLDSGVQFGCVSDTTNLYFAYHM